MYNLLIEDVSWLTNVIHITPLRINRAPVLTLWAAVMAERLGFAWEEALTLGRAVAGLNAYAKDKVLGLFTLNLEAVRKLATDNS
jgi:hypothetical protein